MDFSRSDNEVHGDVITIAWYLSHDLPIPGKPYLDTSELWVTE